jgi:hypothetical protein
MTKTRSLRFQTHHLARLMIRLPQLVVVADRGRIVAYKTEDDGRNLHMFREQSLAEAEHGAGQQVTLDEELQKGAMRTIAEELIKLLNELKPARWAFAAPHDINAAILMEVEGRWLDCLIANISLDLVRESSSSIAERFLAFKKPVSSEF